MQLEQLGWKAHFASAFAELGGWGVPGRVAAAERGRAIVWTEAGECDVPAKDAVTGDWVVVEGGRVAAVLPRRNRFSRKRPGRRTEEQVIAANLDVLFIVTGLDGDFNPRRLERYLVAAAASGVRPVVVLNKTDLCPEPPRVDARSVLTSALTGAGLDVLAAEVAPGETAAFVGSSGAGKSSLVNRLLGAGRQAVAPVRESDSRGRHTTVRREMFVVPPGWLLIDTPGLRELEPWDALAALDAAFSDVAALAAACRFRDCTHRGEPGCAVAGAVAPERLAGFHKLAAELAFLERKSDQRAALEQKRRARLRQRQIREITKAPAPDRSRP